MPKLSHPPPSRRIIIAEAHARMKRHPVVHAPIFLYLQQAIVAYGVRDESLCGEVLPDLLTISGAVQNAIDVVGTAFLSVVELSMLVVRHKRTHLKTKGKSLCEGLSVAP